MPYAFPGGMRCVHVLGKASSIRMLQILQELDDAVDAFVAEVE